MTNDEVVELFMRAAETLAEATKAMQQKRGISNEQRKHIAELYASRRKKMDRTFRAADRAMMSGSATEEQVKRLCRHAEEEIRLAGEIEAIVNGGSRA